MKYAKHGIPLMTLSAAIASVAEAQIQTNPDSVSTLENTSVTFNVLANDTSDQQLSLSFTNAIVTSPGNGELVFDQQTGEHTYIPNTGYTGPDSFIYEATDDDPYGEPIQETVTITVTAAPSDTDLEDQVSGDNTRVVARTITDICTEGQLSTALDSQICRDFSDDEADTAISQVTPEETLLLRRVNNHNLRAQSTRLFRHQRSLRSGQAPETVTFDESSLTLKNYVGGSAGAEVPARMSFFATLHSEDADYSSTAKESGHEYSTNGLTLGGDYRVNPNLFAGAAVGIMKQDLDYDNDAGELDSDIHTLTGYISYFRGPLNIDLQLTYGESDYDIERSLDFFGTTATGKTDGNQYAISTQVEYSITSGGWSVNPFFRLDYLTTEIDGYRESAGGGLGLNVGKQKQDQVNSNLGIDVEYTRGYTWGVLIPTASLTAISESSGNYDPVSFSFIDDASSTTFELRPDSEDSLFYEVQLGAVAVLTGGISCFASYTQSMDLADMDLYRINLGLRAEM
ncbi:MAG: autotransporter domain-containing protein [Ketobacteraceae bacterium]|nr:autotransporter domain-containing protein [Ketobacteraceae bacterium]